MLIAAKLLPASVSKAGKKKFEKKIQKACTEKKAHLSLCPQMINAGSFLTEIIQNIKNT